MTETRLESSPPFVDPARLPITHVRGPMTRQVREALTRKRGEAAWQELLAGVSPDCRAAFAREIGLYEWVEARHSSELSLAYLALEGGASGFTRERSEGAARELLTTLNRWLLRMFSPTFLINAFPRLFGLYYRGGIVTVDSVARSSAQLSLWAEGFYPSWYAEGLPAFLKVALETAGAAEVEVTYHLPEGTGPERHRHQYEVQWK